MKTIDDLNEKYPDSEWLECDPYENVCLCDEEDDDTCTSCDGTGEGMYDGARCSSCKGKGVKSRDDYEAAIERAEYEREQER